MSDHDLVARARGWMAEQHPHFDHMQRALDWTLVLDPDASDAVQIAAVTHDAERAYPDPDSPWDSAVSWADPEYNRWHQERCALIVGEWLREQGAAPELTEEVERLVRAH
jgi:HD superfamily phosphohydrolase YqeK